MRYIKTIAFAFTLALAASCVKEGFVSDGLAPVITISSDLNAVRGADLILEGNVTASEGIKSIDISNVQLGIEKSYDLGKYLPGEYGFSCPFSVPASFSADEIIVITVIDGIGQKTVENVTVTYIPDFDKPTFEGLPEKVKLFMAQDTPLAAYTLSFVAKDNLGLSSVEFICGGVSDSKKLSGTEAEVSYTFEFSETGTVEATVTLYDTSGNSSAEAVTFIVNEYDSVAPVFDGEYESVIALEIPEGEESVSYTLTFNVSDNDELSYMWIRLFDSSWATLVEEWPTEGIQGCESATIERTYTFTEAGTYYYYVYAYDRNGNYGEPNCQPTFEVTKIEPDTQGPVFTKGLPSTDSVQLKDGKAEYTIDVEFHDNVELDYLWVRIYDSSWACLYEEWPTDGIRGEKNATFTKTYELTTTGEYYVYVYAYDMAGNYSADGGTDMTLTVTEDEVPQTPTEPIYAISVPETAAVGVYSFSIGLQDEDGLSWGGYKFCKSDWTQIEENWFNNEGATEDTVEGSVTIPEAGSYLLYVYYYDNAGNYADKTFYFTAE